MGIKILKYVGFFVIFAVIYTLYLHLYGYHIDANYDHFAGLSRCKGILEGNLLLKDWVGSTRTFYPTMFIFMLLPLHLFGFDMSFFYNYSVIIRLLLLLLAVILVLKGSEQNKRINTYNLLILVALLAFPAKGFFAKVMGYPFFHIENYILILLILIISGSLSDKLSKKNIVLYILMFLSSFLLFQDPLMLYVYLLPLIVLICIRRFFSFNNLFQDIITLIVACSSFLLYKIFAFAVEQAGGIYINHTFDSQAKFINILDIVKKIEIVFVFILDLFGADFFNKLVNESIHNLVAFVVFCITIFILFYQIKRFARLDFINQYLIVSPIILFFVAVFSTIISEIDQYTYRNYIVSIPIFLIILFARSNAILIFKKTFENINGKSRFRIIIFAVTFLLLFNMLYNIPHFKSKPENIQNNIVNTLLENNLISGYGPFLKAPEIMFFSGGRIKVLGITEPNNQFEWDTNKRWYYEPANFILSEPYKVDVYINYFGEPAKKICVEDIVILVWDFDISSKINKK